MFDIHLITAEFISLCLKCSCTIYTTISDVDGFYESKTLQGYYDCYRLQESLRFHKLDFII